jgi:hypothetical protein
MFYSSRSELSKIIRIDNPMDASLSIAKLNGMFVSADHNRKVEIKRAVTLAFNRVNAMLKKKDLSEREKQEMKIVSRLYEKTKNEMVM